MGHPSEDSSSFSTAEEEAPYARHDSRVPNIVLFGETGVGKSSVVNLMAGAEVAEISSGLEGCTLSAKPYPLTLLGVGPLNIFDTVGLEEPEMNLKTFFSAMQNARQLVASLHNAGGVHLLLFCIRAGSITTAMQRTYRLFVDFLCGGQVPLAIVVTNLERENNMETWWVRNEATLKRYGIHSISHACITAVPAHVEVHAQKRVESQRALRAMLHDALQNPKSYKREKQGWWRNLARKAWALLGGEERDLSKRLEAECTLSRYDAQKLAKILIGHD